MSVKLSIQTFISLYLILLRFACDVVHAQVSCFEISMFLFENSNKSYKADIWMSKVDEIWKQ